MIKSALRTALFWFTYGCVAPIAQTQNNTVIVSMNASCHSPLLAAKLKLIPSQIKDDFNFLENGHGAAGDGYSNYQMHIDDTIEKRN